MIKKNKNKNKKKKNLKSLKQKLKISKVGNICHAPV
jgi:hypothetical protein